MTNKISHKKLLAAIKTGNLELLKFYVEHGADIHQTRAGYPLYVAAEAGQLECVKFLIQCGTDVNLRGRYDETAITIVCNDQFGPKKNAFAILTALVESGAETNIIMKNGATPLIWASVREQDAVSFMSYLIDNGADINLTNKDRQTAITYSRHWSFNENADYLQARLDQQAIEKRMGEVEGIAETNAVLA